ncbi:MAG: sigma-70 family RNA polymerase sigma factor [Gemmatimonadota bacterium]
MGGILVHPFLSVSSHPGPARGIDGAATVAEPVRCEASPDCELVRRIASGDEAALGALYDRWSTLVHSVAVQLTADLDDAAEVVEEVFWQVWRQAERYREARGAVSTWLTTIAWSRAMDRARTRRRVLAREAPAHHTRLDGVPGPVDVEQEVESAERRGIVALALDALPREQRETIKLCYFRGMSQAEVAAHSGLPLGTVKTRTRLALQKLRGSLAVLRERMD